VAATDDRGRRLPQRVLKVGGTALREAAKQQPGALTVEQVTAAWREPIRFCIETFGPDRCMFESNFSVDKLSMTYATLWDAFDVMSADLSTSERADLFSDTAVRTYRL
jgi:L-fuconolactonase